MLALLHYLPHFLITALGLLALAVMFGDDDRETRKRAHLERPRRRHYAWNDHRAHRD